MKLMPSQPLPLRDGMIKHCHDLFFIPTSHNRHKFFLCLSLYPSQWNLSCFQNSSTCLFIEWYRRETVASHLKENSRKFMLIIISIENLSDYGSRICASKNNSPETLLRKIIEGFVYICQVRREISSSKIELHNNTQSFLSPKLQASLNKIPTPHHQTSSYFPR